MMKNILLIMIGMMQGGLFTKYYYENHLTEQKAFKLKLDDKSAKVAALQQKYDIEQKQHSYLISKFIKCKFSSSNFIEKLNNLNDKITTSKHQFTNLKKLQLDQKQYYENNEFLYTERFQLSNKIQSINQKILTSTFEIKNKEKFCRSAKIKSKYKKFCNNFESLVKNNQAMLLEFEKLSGQLDVIMRKLKNQKNLLHLR